MKTCKITVMRRSCYEDLMALYENPIEHACEMKIGQEFLSIDGKRPESMCENAWRCMERYVYVLANGGGNFFDGWMKNEHSAMISCDDGFRPVSYYIEVID